MSPPPPTYTLRPFHPSTTDMSAIATISALANIYDPLTKHMTRNINEQWTSYRNSCRRFLQRLLARPGTLCYVAESVISKEVVGWAIWTRYGESDVAKGWRRGNGGVMNAVERGLLAVEGWYFGYVPGVDPAMDRKGRRELMPVLGEEWPGEIFREYWELDGLYVHPSHYRRGIGGMLASWGVERGREENVPVVVRSSPVGRKVYERVGFEVVRRRRGVGSCVGSRTGRIIWRGPGGELRKRERKSEVMRKKWMRQQQSRLRRVRIKKEDVSGTCKKGQKVIISLIGPSNICLEFRYRPIGPQKFKLTPGICNVAHTFQKFQLTT
jgi:GNAT superfamily N-acetyltransferase